jgi:hypothetical protein
MLLRTVSNDFHLLQTSGPRVTSTTLVSHTVININARGKRPITFFCGLHQTYFEDTATIRLTVKLTDEGR